VMKTRHKGDKNYEKNGFIRIDMSEYSSKHEVSRLIGSPPGYVGHEEGGQLTTKLAQCPEAVVLLDEVEKAHPDVLTLMLQVFDEGRLTDGRGNTINCPKAIFIMTSNLVQDEIREAADDKTFHLRPESEDPHEMEAKVAVDTQEFLRKTVHPILKRHFKRDEFLGRINDMLIFHPFSMHDLRVIVNMELSKWASKANQRHKIAIKWTDKVMKLRFQDKPLSMIYLLQIFIIIGGGQFDARLRRTIWLPLNKIRSGEASREHLGEST